MSPEWSSSNTPIFVVTRIVFWASIVVGLFVGIAAFDAASAFRFSAYILGYLSKIIAAAVVLLVGIIIARFLSRSVLINGVNMNLQYARLLSLGVKWLVLVFTAAMVLDHLGIARSIVDIRLRHSVRRDRAGADAGCRPGLARSGQPIARTGAGEDRPG